MTIRLITLSTFALFAALCIAQPSAAPNAKDAQGRKQGPWQRTWAESSQLRYVGQFKDDRPVGQFTYYSTTGNVESKVDHYPGSNAAHGRHFHANGKLMAEGRYLGQEKDSTWNYYSDAGTLNSTEHWKAGKMDGEMTSFYSDGSVAERRHFVSGVENGKAEQFFADSKPRYTANYVNGAPEGTEVYFYPKGNKEIQGTYVNGSRDGGWTYYNEDGSVQMQVLYAQGSFVKQKYENGTFKEYWDDQQIKCETSYKNGKREGPFTEWFDNGTWSDIPVKLGPEGEEKADAERELKGQTKKREGVYKNDMLDGPVKYYDDKGNLTSTEVYVNGTLASSAVK